jgi:ubiquinone/menaquinone biosynthesis C-methylase UbiE
VTAAGESLSSGDRALLERLLANEGDMAFRRRVPILLEYLELADGLEILDCGCGMGFYLMAIQHLRAARLTGLDDDRERMRYAERYGVRAKLVVGDAQALPFPDESFDRVLMSEVLEHVPDDKAAAREAFRVLRPGGILAISVPHARYPFWWDPINATWLALGGKPIRTGPIAGIWSNHERLYEPPQAEALMLEAGFEIEALVESTHYSFPFIHFLVYGIGKPLIEKNLVPQRMVSTTDRFSGLENRGSRMNVFNAVRSFFRLVDRLNDRPGAPRRRTFVNVLAKARKPRDGRRVNCPTRS